MSRSRYHEEPSHEGSLRYDLQFSINRKASPKIIAFTIDLVLLQNIIPTPHNLKGFILKKEKRLKLDDRFIIMWQCFEYSSF